MKYVTFKDGHMLVDLKGFLSSPEGKKALEEANNLTDKLVEAGYIVDLTEEEKQSE